MCDLLRFPLLMTVVGSNRSSLLPESNLRVTSLHMGSYTSYFKKLNKHTIRLWACFYAMKERLLETALNVDGCSLLRVLLVLEILSEGLCQLPVSG